jgi:hypothetical protein
MKKILFSFVILLFGVGCTTTEQEFPYEADIIPVLNENYGDIIRQNCTFSMEYYHRLYRKPEFAQIRDQRFCEGNFQIRNLELFTDDSVQVEFRISYTGNRQVVRDFLRGWPDMKKRYATLDSLRIPDYRHGYAWTYLDPYDQDIFVGFPDESGGIFGTQSWKQLESVHEWIRDLSKTRGYYTDLYSIVLVKSEDGVWQIVSEKSTDGYSPISIGTVKNYSIPSPSPGP